MLTDALVSYLRPSGVLQVGEWCHHHHCLCVWYQGERKLCGKAGLNKNMKGGSLGVSYSLELY